MKHRVSILANGKLKGQFCLPVRRSPMKGEIVVSRSSGAKRTTHSVRYGNPATLGSRKLTAWLAFVFVISWALTTSFVGSLQPVYASYIVSPASTVTPTPKVVNCPKQVVLREEIKQYIECKDWSGMTKEAKAVARAESGYNPEQRNLNKGHSLDRGIFQINDVYHPEVSMLCAFDAKCNIDAANRIFHAHKNSFSGQWSAWDNGSYKQFMETE